MKNLFIGDTRANTGPANVNKGITSNLTSEYLTISYGNKVLSYVQSLVKLLFCNTLIISGLSKQGVLLARLGKKINKKVIYIMHGCYEAEIELNEEIAVAQNLEYERCILELSDLILPVSKRYMLWVMERYPQYKEKMDYLYNGVEENHISYEGIERKKGSIIAVGGDRKLKNNVIVGKAMHKLGSNAKLQVYGHIHNPDNLPQSDNVEFLGLVPQNELYRRMAASDIYVLNSIFEPFALSVIDAINCGCSILVTRIAGVTDILDLEETDIIFDPMDTDEIANKLNYLLNHPNNERIVSKLNYDKWSYKAEVERLTQLCTALWVK